MSRKAQAILELSLFLGVMLMVLLAALSYRRNLREQNETDVNVFEQAVLKAHNNTFIDKDIDGEEWECSGATVSYSLNADRQANRIFQGGQRRTTGSSASVYDSNAEDPPSLDYSYYNNIDIGPEKEVDGVKVNAAFKKKIYYPRPGGTEDPEDGLKLSTADYISAAYPLLSSLAQSLFNLKDTGWWKNWGASFDYYARLASYLYFTARYYTALQKLDESEAEREALEDADEEMGEWGWRVCDEVHDGKSRAGKEYVKEITAQVYDISTEENKSIVYNETQQATPGYTSTRRVGVGHVVERKFWRRFDETVPNPTISLANHTFAIIGQGNVTVDLSGGQSENWSAP